MSAKRAISRAIFLWLEQNVEMPTLQRQEVSDGLAEWLERACPLAADFQNEQWKWVQETFPDETPEGVLKHLQSEMKELSDAPTDPEEMADVFLLLQCLASHHRIHLVGAARAKFEKCKARTWEKTAEGYRHVKE